MKPTKLILLILLAFAFVQCSDDHAELLDVNGPLSRSITPTEESETNPTLLTDWENCKTVKLNEVNSAGQNLEATLPWQDGAETSLDRSFCKDIKSADGWTMLFHTFCKSNVDVNLSYMCFYNKFTGYLKIFFTHEILIQALQQYGIFRLLRIRLLNHYLPIWNIFRILLKEIRTIQFGL